ncbi:hypothetical protein [Glutamicibacter soli]
MAKKKKSQALFNLRTAVILQAAIIAGSISGWLSYLVAPILPGAIGAGLAAGCMTVVVLNNLIAEL